MGEVAELKAEVEKNLASMLADGLFEPKYRDTAKLLLYAIQFGCKNIDKLAERSGLPRDRFVRPRARRLRESGVWSEDGLVYFETIDGPPEHTNIEFVLHVMCAEGLIRCVGRDPAPKWDMPNYHRLFAWRSKMLPGPVRDESILVESLGVEALSQADTPAEFQQDVIAFRQIPEADRLTLARGYLDSPDGVEVAETDDHVPTGSSGV
jgi:hypothetical protein